MQPMPQNVRLSIENGDCRAAAHRLLSVLAYPAHDECDERDRFCDAADSAAARWLKTGSSNGLMPIQQSQNTLRRGMRRVGHRLAAAYIFRAVVLSTAAGPRSIASNARDLDSVSVSGADPKPLAVLSALRKFTPGLSKLMPVGALDQKALKNLQDRVIRPSLPVLYIANVLLSRATRPLPHAKPDAPQTDWRERLLQRPQDWLRPVVAEATTNRDAHWLACREANLIFPHDAMISVELVESQADAA